MQQDLQQHYGNTICGASASHTYHGGLWIGDAAAIYANSYDFLERSSRINRTAEALADWLKGREEVSQIYYPKYTQDTFVNGNGNDSDTATGYESLLNHPLQDRHQHTPGYGGVMSIILHPHICQRTFYDQLDLSKGPSLGTNFTLVCPYTLLAHYHELDFAMSYQVQPNLIRIAVGLEDLEVLEDRFETALGKSVLHRKLPLVAADGGRPMGSGVARGYCTSRDIDVAASCLGVPSTRRSIGSSSRLTPTVYNAGHFKNHSDGGRSRYTSTTTMPLNIHMGSGGLRKVITSELKKTMTTRTMGMWSRRTMSSLLLRRPCC